MLPTTKKKERKHSWHTYLPTETSHSKENIKRHSESRNEKKCTFKSVHSKTNYFLVVFTFKPWRNYFYSFLLFAKKFYITYFVKHYPFENLSTACFFRINVSLGKGFNEKKEKRKRIRLDRSKKFCLSTSTNFGENLNIHV